MDRTNVNDRNRKALSLVILTANGALLPLLVRHVRTRSEEKLALPSTIVLLAEVLKFLMCVTALWWQKEKDISQVVTSIHEAVAKHPLDTLKVCLPSLIYIMQNNLYHIALSNLEASRFATTYQIRILTTAVFYVVLLNKTLSQMQWTSLIVLMVGVVLVQDTSGNETAVLIPVNSTNPGTPSLSTTVSLLKKSAHQGNEMVGLITVLVMCLTSGFAGVYFEKVLKGSTLSIWMQNVRLAVVGIPIAALAVLFKDAEQIWHSGFLQGYDWIVWLVTWQSACNGLIVAFVMKYADNILKSYAQSLAIVLSCIGSTVLFDFVPSGSFSLGTVFVACSIYLYNAFPPMPTDSAQPSPQKPKLCDCENGQVIHVIAPELSVETFAKHPLAMHYPT